MRLLALDPSVRGTGAACFGGNLLAAVEVWKCDLPAEPKHYGSIAQAYAWLPGWALTDKWDVIVCEVPEVYHHTPRPQDLIAVAIVAGALCTIPAEKVRTFLPKTWKGQVPKKIHHDRILSQLLDHELQILEAAKKDIGVTLFHNALDAVGLGLWYLQEHHGRAKYI